MKKTIIPVFAAAALLSVSALTACSQTAAAPTSAVQNENPKNNVISVQSSEKIQVVPDITQITFAVSTQAEQARDCQSKNAEELDKVIKLLEAQGIESKSMQTSNYGLNPIYDWNNSQQITGYQMETTLTVSDVPIDQTGTLITACVDAGVNNIQNISYLSSKYDESYQEALTKAIAAARTKAAAIAAADGRSISTMLHVEERSDYQEARYTGYRAAAGAGANATEQTKAAAAMDVAPGQLDIEAGVTVEFLME